MRATYPAEYGSLDLHVDSVSSFTFYVQQRAKH